MLGLFLFTQCSDFGDVNKDPNNPTSPDTRYLYLYAATFMPDFGYMGNYDPWNQLYPQYLSEQKNIQYTKFTLTEFSTLNYYRYVLKNLANIIKFNEDEETKMEGWVTKFGDNANQIAVCRTMEGFVYMHLTDIVGMTPYSEALKGDEGNFTPKYDTQEFIYTDLDRKLNEAYAQFDESKSLDDTYEILYKGDISKWKKLNASIRMMMAIKLSKVDPVNGQARFAKAYNDGGIVDNADILQYAYLPETANENPLYYNIVVSGREDFAPSATIINQLNAYNDPRVKAYASPNTNGEYVGVIFGLTQNHSGQLDLDLYSKINEKYYKQDAPQILTTPSQVLLMCAEAAERGWISANSADLYKQAIVASFEQNGIDGAQADAYCEQPDVKLEGSVDQRIAKIAMQRWLANYMQDGTEAWSDWRRLGVPDLKVGENTDEKHIPYRRYYAATDYIANKDNYNAAIALQGANNFDTKVWWHK